MGGGKKKIEGLSKKGGWDEREGQSKKKKETLSSVGGGRGRKGGEKKPEKREWMRNKISQKKGEKE